MFIRDDREADEMNLTYMSRKAINHACRSCSGAVGSCGTGVR
jgi:hypothetical protein